MSLFREMPAAEEILERVAIDMAFTVSPAARLSDGKYPAPVSVVRGVMRNPTSGPAGPAEPGT